jgi:hypothetical protein
MRRPARLGLIVAISVIVAVAGYSAYWRIAAGQIEAGIDAWAESARAQNLVASWQKLRVGGYPFAFEIEFIGAHFRDDALRPAPDISAPLLSATASPWNFRDWTVAAPAGLDAALGPGGEPLARLAAGTAAGTVDIAASGAVAIWLDLGDAKAEASGIGAAIDEAQFWVGVPAASSRREQDRGLAVAADLHLATIPLPLPPLGNTIGDIAFAAAIVGPVPPGPARQAAASWRDAGGTIDVDHLHLAWNALAIDASGTLALDRDLQPMGSFSGTVAGYDQLLAALASAGRIRTSDARFAAAALGVIARPGPRGAPQIATSLTLQNGAVYLGPAKLGPVPRIPW